MDPYFKPILWSTLFVIVFNTILVLPFKIAPLLVYFLAGVIAVYLFRKEIEETVEVKVFDASVLGIATGILVGAILSFLFTLKLQNPEFKMEIINFINESMRMKTDVEFAGLTELGPIFYMITSAFTILSVSLICLFGSISSLLFVNQPRK